MRQLFYSSEILLVNKVAPPINIPMPKINKYILISQTKIRAKPVTNFLDTAQLHAN